MPKEGKQLAQERRLFCTAELEKPRTALVAMTGKAVLMTSR